MSRCRSCGAEIEWVQVGAKRMPLDVDPDPENGNIVVWKRDQVTVFPSNVDARAAASSTVANLRISHFATCPQAGQWRSRKPS